MFHWIQVAWDYIWAAVSAHPFNFFYLLIIGVFSLAAFVVSMRSLAVNRSQAESAKRQAEEAARSRQLNETALASQADALRTQAQDTARALAVAEQNAKAATETAQAIKALGEVGQRAWVTVTDIQIASAVPLQGAVLVDTQVSNRGKTPALDVLINSRLYVTDKVPEVPEFKSFDKHDSLGVMASDVPNWLHNRIDPDDANIVSLYQKKSVLILCGKADYRDVFGSVRCTTWAYYFEPRQGRFVVSPSGSKLT